VPKPLGVLLTSDQQAGEFLDACDRATVAVPRDVSVMGVDNDDVFCEVQRVPLSSIITDNRMIGYRAAEMLDGLLHSSEPTRSHGSHHGRRQAASVAWLTVLVPPLGIASRGSTDAIPSDDPAVAQAARFVREHAHRAISVDDVAEASGVSRRNLERRFRAAMGRSVLDAIRQAHVERAKTLLAHTDQGLDAVALASGFGSRERLSVVFQKFTRETPAAYRKKCLRRG
jgi:LacI family transcriptional regulator